VEFSRPLAIPPLAESTVDPEGRRMFDLTVEKGFRHFGSGVATPTLGYNGSYLGPTIVAERGEPVGARVRNELTEVTTVHWHGMHLPAIMDGGPHQPIAPGETWRPEWTIDQPAATLWYHPHPHGATEHQVGMGLAGLVIVRDDHEQSLPLPRTYGVDDVPVIVQDVRFDSERAFETRLRGFVGPVGDTVLVNGTLAPYFDVTSTLVRLRLLNASAARTYEFAFGDSREFAMIASDGGLLAAPADVDHLRLSPGERAEIVVEIAPGETTVLRSLPLSSASTVSLPRRMPAGTASTCSSCAAGVTSRHPFHSRWPSPTSRLSRQASPQHDGSSWTALPSTVARWT
jgi:FtsP/CotA-like multicopper oxidase with cupredoxin domain